MGPEVCRKVPLRTPRTTTLLRARRNVLEKVRSPSAVHHLVRFYDPANGYAGLSFLDLFPSGPNAIGPGDLLAPGLMSAPLTSKQCRQVLDRKGTIEAALAGVRDVDIAVATDQELGDALRLYKFVKEALQTNEARNTKARLKAYKLCARKRPRLIPIADSRVREATKSDSWLTFRHLMTDPAIVEELEKARTAASGTIEEIADLPLLRVLDTILWMR